MTQRRSRSASSRVIMDVAVRLAAIQVIGGLAPCVALAEPSLDGAPVAQVTESQASKLAEAFVQENIDRGYSILNSTVSADQRHAQFQDFMLGLMDGRRIGMFTLGQYANGAPKADIDAFITTFSDYTVAVYETRLGKYKDQILKVVGSSARTADDVVVNCESTDPAHPADPPYKVAFRVRKNAEGKFVVTDLNIEGIWQALTQRADFTGFLQQHGGRIAELTLDLNRAKRDIADERNGERFRTDEGGFQPANSADDRLRPV